MENELRELLDRVRLGESGAFESLAERYLNLTESAVRRFAPSFGISREGSDSTYDLDDLRQNAAMALYRAAETYRPNDEGQKVSFGLYAKVCVSNALISELRKYRRRSKTKTRRVRTATSESSTDGHEAGHRRRGCIAEGDPIYRLVSEEELRDTLERFRSGLSPYEREVFEDHIVGKSVVEIAERLGRNEKSVSNALYRMKVKVRGLLKDQ